MKARRCTNCMVVKDPRWKFCPFCGDSRDHDLGRDTEGMREEDISKASCLPSPIMSAFDLIRNELAIQTGKAERLTRENELLTKGYRELEASIVEMKKPAPFHVGTVIGRRDNSVGLTKVDQVDYVLQIEHIDFVHPLVNIRVRLP